MDLRIALVIFLLFFLSAVIVVLLSAAEYALAKRRKARCQPPVSFETVSREETLLIELKRLTVQKMIFDHRAAEQKLSPEEKAAQWKPVEELEQQARAALANHDHDLARDCLQYARSLSMRICGALDHEDVEWPLQ